MASSSEIQGSARRNARRARSVLRHTLPPASTSCSVYQSCWQVMAPKRPGLTERVCACAAFTATGPTAVRQKTASQKTASQKTARLGTFAAKPGHGYTVLAAGGSCTGHTCSQPPGQEKEKQSATHQCCTGMQTLFEKALADLFGTARTASGEEGTNEADRLPRSQTPKK